MEVVEIETTDPGAGTAGSPAEEEKLLPPGKEPASPILVLPPEDLLHRGNAVAAAQEKQEPEKESSEELFADRDLRETGLKEALPRGERAPSKIDAPEDTDTDGLPKMHTYAEDMSAEIQKRGTTISSIITAEKMKGGDEEPAPRSPAPRRWPLLVGAALFLILGAGAIGGVVWFEMQPKASAPAMAGIIPVNHSVTLSTDGATPLTDLLAGAKSSAQMNLGEIEAINLTTGSTSESVQDILTALGAPNELVRNATGVVVGLHAFDHVAPFLIIPVSAYDRAFAAMLAWEPTMGTSLGSFFAPPGAPMGITSHPPALSFTDLVSDNLDTRESQSAWPILYAFPRQDLLVITTNENTLKEIMTRLTLQNASNQ